MHTTSPGKTTVITLSDLPSGQIVGIQVIKAANGLVSIGRTTTGVVERPPGSGAYVVTFVAPAEGDLFLLVADWSGGVISDSTTRVEELNVTAEVQPGSSGLGYVADYTKMYLGGETWRGLADSLNYGTPFIARAIEVVKRRVFTNPPDTANENTLPVLVLDYLGICAALELIPAARDWWMNQHISISEGDDPTEIVTYANRAALMKDLQDDLLRRLPAARDLALPLIDDPVLTALSDVPAIDEDDDLSRVTADPRHFPGAGTFPYDSDDPRGIFRTGVRV